MVSQRVNFKSLMSAQIIFMNTINTALVFLVNTTLENILFPKRIKHLKYDYDKR